MLNKPYSLNHFVYLVGLHIYYILGNLSTPYFVTAGRVLYYFLGSDLYSFFFYVRMIFVSFSFVWVRGTLPRFRYDRLMYLAWKRFLPLSLNYLLFFVGLRRFIFSLL